MLTFDDITPVHNPIIKALKDQFLSADTLTKLAIARQIINARKNAYTPSESQINSEPSTNNQSLPESQSRRDTSDFYEYNPDRKPAQRKRENAAAIALLKQFRNGDFDETTITDEQRAILAKYSGLGGALIGEDGQKGSAYEYYTPKPIAEGVWDLAKELGFSGGKVLDPCGGVGIFGATAPLNAVIDAVELDKTSGAINKLVNQGVGYNVIDATPYEKVAGATDNEIYDAIVSNVPFGDNKARGSNKKHDQRYQNESLQAYFILRCLEKLKPKGLAVFIVPPSVTTGKGSKEVDLRVQASYMAEFLGAYRLPNEVFGTAAADTITDVIAFRKFDKPTLEKIDELRDQAPQTLIDANVQWQEYTTGKYFTGEGKRFILGESATKKNQYGGMSEYITTTASVGEIGKMLKKFPGSRINWELLEATETALITYQDGDFMTQAGQTLQYQQGVWLPIESQSKISLDVDRLSAQLSDAYTAFEHHISVEQASQYLEKMREIDNLIAVPTWLIQTLKSIETLDNEKREQAWQAGIVGLSAAQVIDEQLKIGNTGVNYLEDYAALSESMMTYCSVAKTLSSKTSGPLKEGLQKLSLHCKKTGYSGLWRGDVETTVKIVETTAELSFEGLLYTYQSTWLDLATAKTVLGANFNPLHDDAYCISADGLSVCKADDYYSGNYRQFLNKLDADIANAANDDIKNKLIRQKTLANDRLARIDVKSLSFQLNSPLVDIEQKLAFMQKFVHSQAFINYDSDGKAYVDIDLKADSDKSKLYNRFGDYMKNGTVSIGGAKLNVGNAKGLDELRKMIATANEQFDSWVKANPAIMQTLESAANSIDSTEFAPIEDEAKLIIPNMNPALNLHGYQNAFVRKMSRDFSGINGFGVGLGKTFTALAAVQYAQAMGVKKKTLFVVPNSVLSNWQKEAGKAYDDTSDCLYVGLRSNAKGKASVDSKAYDEDLLSVLENKHSKIFVTYEGFKRIKMRDSTLKEYENYLGIADKAYTPSMDVKEREKAESKKADLMSVFEGKKGAAPYLEDMGIDSIVFDEAHIMKNASTTVETKSAKFLSLSSASGIGLEAQAKCWYIRGQSPRNDGVLMLTATPLTNSPLEYYSMLSLAKGHQKVNDMMLGIKGADDFMMMVCDVVSEPDVSIDGIQRDVNVFKGLNNVKLLRRSLGLSSTIKTAEDVGNQVELPEEDAKTIEVSLPDELNERLLLYKGAFRYAIDLISEKSDNDNRGDKAAYDIVQAYFDEPLELIGHPFNLINKMTLLIQDPELDQRVTKFTINPDDKELALKAIEEFNKKKIIEQRQRKSPITTEAAVVGKITKKDAESGEKTEILKIHALAKLDDDGKTILIDTIDSVTQLKFDEILAKLKLDVNVTIPPKLAAMLENVKKEHATPRGIDDDGNKSPIVKQIIFCDVLAMHSKIKRLLAQKAGISSGKIAIITGKTNNTPEEIMAVQDGFNAHGEDNQYNVIIANEKAEVGINLQKGTQAIHHLTIGWTPDSITQRNGRGVRQGNKTEKVTVYMYDADGTFDAVKRNMVNKKADWISDVMAKDGENKVAITGGLTREQQEELLSVVGDKEAMKSIQDRVASREANNRSKANRDRQTVNLDTIRKQAEFIRNNDPIGDFVLPKFAQIYVLQKQISDINNKISKAKTKEATDKLVAAKATIERSYKTFESEIDSCCGLSKTVRSGSTEEAESKTVSNILDDYKTSYKSRGEGESSENFVKFIKNRGYIITVNEGSAIDTDWQAEMAMAKSMITEATSNYERQAKETGAYPAAVASAMAEGQAIMLNGKPLVSGACIADVYGSVGILFLESGWRGVLPYIKTIQQGNYYKQDYEYEDQELIMKGMPGYEDCLIKAAQLEDQSTLNSYSDLNGEVLQYRKTAKLIEYPIGNYLLPAPYFPVVITDHQVQKIKILEPLKIKQQEIVKSINGSYFKVTSDTEVSKTESSIYISKAYFDYAIAHQLKPNLFEIESTEWTQKLQQYFDQHANLNDFIAQVDAEKASIFSQNADTVTIDFDSIKSMTDKWLIDYFTQVMSDTFVIPDLTQIPEWHRYPVTSAFNKYFDQIRFELIRWYQENKPTPETTESATVEESYSEQSESEIKDPQEAISITGDTKRWKDDIKKYASQYGGGKFRWDGRNTCWVVRRIVLQKLNENYPKTIQDLNEAPATMRI